MTTYKPLLDAWNNAADALEDDPIRPVRYSKCFRYLRTLDLNSKLLEVGCGEGTGLTIAQYLGFKDLTGVEVSTERIRRAQRKLGGLANLISISPDNRLPFRENSFDIVISAAVIEHTLDPAGFVREIARVTRPDGHIVISSDCWQWRILQLLRIYRTAQPIDKAPFPTTLFKIFRDCRLQLLHYEGFPLPGQEYYFGTALAEAFLPRPLVGHLSNLSRLPGRAIRKIGRTLGVVSPHLAAKSDQREPDAFEIVKTVVNEPWNSNHRTRGLLKLVFSNENVFSLVK